MFVFPTDSVSTTLPCTARNCYQIHLSGGLGGGVGVQWLKQASEKAGAGTNKGQTYTCRARLQKREAPVSPLLKESYTKSAFRQKR